MSFFDQTEMNMVHAIVVSGNQSIFYFEDSFIVIRTGFRKSPLTFIMEVLMVHQK